MSVFGSTGYFLRVFFILIVFVMGLIPGMWAAYRGLKALAYYLKMKIDGDNSAY